MHLALDEFRRVLKPGGRLLVTSGRKGLSKIRFVRDQVLCKMRNRSSYLLMARRLVRILLPFLRIAYYNVMMYKLARTDGYRQFTKDDLGAAICNSGFVDLAHETVYAGLLHLVEARAPLRYAQDPVDDPETRLENRAMPLAHSVAAANWS